MSNQTGLFLKGGIGCIVAFIVLGLFTLLLGGHVHADAGGLAILFVLGGGTALVAGRIYQKGRRDAERDRG